MSGSLSTRPFSKAASGWWTAVGSRKISVEPHQIMTTRSTFVLELGMSLRELLGEVALVLAGLDVRAVEALDVVLVEDGGHGLDGFEEGLDAASSWSRSRTCGVAGGVVEVVGEDVPAGEDDVVERGERDEVLDEGGAVVGALAEADGAHLGDGADGLGEAVADCFYAGDEGGGDGSHAGS